MLAACVTPMVLPSALTYARHWVYKPIYSEIGIIVPFWLETRRVAHLRSSEYLSAFFKLLESDNEFTKIGAKRVLEHSKDESSRLWTRKTNDLLLKRARMLA